MNKGNYRVLVGLGSPGDNFKHTKKNIGSTIVDKFIDSLKIEKNWNYISNSSKSLIVGDLTIIKPLTEIKDTRKELKTYCGTIPFAFCSLTVICEDVNLKLGLYQYCNDKKKERVGLIKELGNDDKFHDMKIIKVGVKNGISPSKKDLNKNFTNKELSILHSVKHSIVEDLKTLYLTNDFDFLKDKNLQHLNHIDRYLIDNSLEKVKKIHLREVLAYVKNTIPKEYRQSTAVILNNLKLKNIFTFNTIECLKKTLEETERDTIVINQLLYVYQNSDLVRDFYQIKSKVSKVLKIDPNIYNVIEHFVSGLKILKLTDLRIDKEKIK